MAEATAIRNNALPYPVYGLPWTIVFPLLDADGDPVSPSSPDSEVSKNGDTFSDCTNEMTEIATSSGVCYLTLTGTEMTADAVALLLKSTGAKSTVAVLYPRKLVSLRTGTVAANAADGTTLQLDSGASAVDDYYNGCLLVGVIDSVTEARIISDYVGSTKVCTVSPAFNTAPDNNDTFTVYLPEGRQINQADNVAFNAVATTSSAGRPEVNTSHIAGSAVSTSSAQIGVNVVNAGGTAWASGAITANVLASDCITAAKIATGAIDADAIADNAIDAGALAADCITAAKIANGAIDAATFAADVDAEILSYIVDDATRIDASALNTLSSHDPGETIMGATDLGTGSGFTAIPWNAAWDAEVQSEVQDAIEVNHLDHLLAVTYDPASKPGAADALLNELVENDGGVARYTANALEQAPSGSGATAQDVWEYDISAISSAGMAGKIVNDILVDTGTTLQGELDGIQADTEDLQTRLPAALTADGNIKADTLRVSGTTQTARDLGASVLISSGTGTGQLSVSSGVIAANVTQFNGSNATSASGRPEVNMTHIANNQTPVTNLWRYFSCFTTGTADSGTTTTMVDAARTEVDDYWNGQMLVFRDGSNVAIGRVITDFVAGTDTFTFSPALPNAVSTENYVIVPVSAYNDLVAIQALISGLNNISAAQVNAEVLDVLNVDTFAEPTGVPAATTTLAEKIGRLHQALRNKVEVTASKKTFYDDADAALWEKDLSDNGTTYSETEGNSV